MSAVTKEERYEKHKKNYLNLKAGMELVQVAILIAIAIALGIIFKTEITSFVNKTFKALNASKFLNPARRIYLCLFLINEGNRW